MLLFRSIVPLAGDQVNHPVCLSWVLMFCTGSAAKVLREHGYGPVLSTANCDSAKKILDEVEKLAEAEGVTGKTR